jgi:restriction system protein
LGPDEHAAFVTLAGFTKQAIAEAQAPGRKGIMLIDGEMLVDMILEHYDELSEEYKELLKLEKKGAPLREQFATLR